MSTAPVTVPSDHRMAITKRRRHLAIGVLPCLLAASALSACGGGNAASSAPNRTEVRSATIPGLGRVLVDGADYTVYAYMPDHRGPSRCFGNCAKTWPPLVLPASQKRAVAGPGIRGSLLGTVRRPNGDRQVTYDGWPLYTTADTTPGQANGQHSTMGLWYAISVSGVVDHGVVDEQER